MKNNYGKITNGLELTYNYGTNFIEGRYDNITQNIGDNRFTKAIEKIYNFDKNLIKKGYDTVTNDIEKGYNFDKKLIKKGYDILNNSNIKIYDIEKKEVEESYSFGKKVIENNYAKLTNYLNRDKKDDKKNVIDTKQQTISNAIQTVSINPKTGDYGIIPWISLMIGSLLGIAIVIIIKSKMHK